MVPLTALHVIENSSKLLGQTITVSGQLSGIRRTVHMHIMEEGRMDLSGILLKQPGLYAALCVSVGLGANLPHHITATGRLIPSEIPEYAIMLDNISYIEISFKGKRYVLDPQDIQRPAESELRIADEYEASAEDRERFIQSLWESRRAW